MRRVDVASTLLFDEDTNKILMVKNYRNGYIDMTLPGGAVDPGETLAEAAVREVKEETGYDVTVSDIVAVTEAKFETGNHAMFFTFLGKITGGSMEITLPDEIADVLWVDIDEVDAHITNFNVPVKQLVNTNANAPYFNRGFVNRRAYD
jgi:8-oxo-dGTP diphosphatase